MIKTVCLFLAWGAVLMAQPQFTHKFETAVSASITAGHGTGRDLAPWFVDVTNTTDRKIVGLTVKYDYHLTLANGVDSGAISVLHAAPGGAAFLPGEVYYFTPFGYSKSSASDPKTERQLRQLHSLATEVSVSIDAVAFVDGEIVGPDTAGLGERLKTESRTVSAIRREFAEAVRSGQEEGYVETLASTTPVGDSGDPRGMMHNAPYWEHQIRWQTGLGLRYTPSSERAAKLQLMDESAAPIRRREVTK